MANNLRAIRKEKNMTMKELGEKVGVTEAAIGYYETGKRLMNYEMLLMLSEALECSVGDIIEDKKIPASDHGDGQLSDYENAVLNASERERDIILKVLKLPPEQQDAFLTLMQSVPSNQADQDESKQTE